MNALSISSNECVVPPSTRLSIRIQPISYMNDDAPVTAAAKKNNAASPSALAVLLAARAAIAGALGWGSSLTSTQTVTANAMFSKPAVMIVPGNPTRPISQKPLASTPIAAPMLFVKYNIARLPPG